MSIHADIQRLEPGKWVELFDLDATAIGGDMLRFHGYTQVGPIWWQGNEYSPWPIQVTGFAKVSDGQQPSPTLKVGDVEGRITALCLFLAGLAGARLTRHQTLGKYLDAANFPDGNQEADPSEELAPELWIVEQVAEQRPLEFITFALSSALDFGDAQLPARQIVANVCMWLTKGGYRGPYCGYTGGALFDRDNNPVADPTLDRCSGRLSSCKVRFGENNPLPYGSFPAADLIRS
jgi:lambda family phage minor tail protein L